MKEYYSPNEFALGTDSARINAAVQAAHETGTDRVVIPRVNARTGGTVWEIGETVFLPSHMTVVLDGAHLRMADGVFCRMFCNTEADTALGQTAAGEQTDIHITGQNGAVLDGGLPNGLNERTSGKNGLPHVGMNLTVYFHNVSRFSVRDLTVRDQRWWGMEFMFARDGVVSGIRFELTRHAEDSRAVWRNQDGIDLRVGCSNIVIEDISGETGDDTVALTALTGPRHEGMHLVEGRDTDIHDVVIRNVRAVTNMCAIVRLLNQYGNRIYNVTMRDIFDMSRPGETNRAQMVLRLGENAYRDEDHKAHHGDMYNIVAQNIHSRAMTAILTSCTIKNFHASDIYVHTDGQYVWACGGHHMHVKGDGLFIYLPSREDEAQARRIWPCGPGDGITAENILIENVYHTARRDDPAESLFCFNAAQVRNAAVRNVCCDGDIPLYAVTNPVPGLHVRFQDVVIAGKSADASLIK